MDNNFSFQRQALFWKHVNILDLDDCWIWTGYKDSDGYGEVRFDKKFRTHRYVYMLYHNFVPLKTTDFICHTCDNPSCVNPNHLFLGDVQINTADMVHKGRQAKGETCGNCKMTYEQLDQLFEDILFGKYKSYSQISKKYHISVTHISRIFEGKFRHYDTDKLCQKYNTTLDSLKLLCKGIKF